MKGASPMNVRTKGVAALGLLVLAASTACSTTAPGSGSGGDVTVGPGVTDSTITLGYMTDLSGPISSQGKTDLAATKLYLQKLNAAGGICGRKVELKISDMGYDVQKAVAQYPSITPNVLGYLALLGTPMLEALDSRIRTDDVAVGALDWDSSHLGNPNIIQFGTTYDIEDVNGLSYLFEHGVIKKGDTVGILYWPGYGENALTGFKYAADKLGLQVKAIEVDPTKTDLTTQVQELHSAGVTLVSVATLQAQAAAVATETQSMDWQVPILGNDPSFVPQVLDTPAKQALVQRMWITSQRKPLGAGTPASKEIIAAFNKEKPDVDESDGLVLGWANAQVYTDILKKACANGDLSRAGVMDAVRDSSAMETGGMFPTLDYSQPGTPATRSSFISRPDPSLVGGLKLITPDPYTSDLAKNYPMPTD
jgi:ABC-type branched-subunit amino acid transport system substrate-binding protein